MTGYAGVRVCTRFDPYNADHDRLISQAQMTGRIQLRRVGAELKAQWLLALPEGHIFVLNVINAIDDQYIREAIDYTPDMSHSQVAWRLGMWHADHVAFCSTVRTADPDGLGINRRESA